MIRILLFFIIVAGAVCTGIYLYNDPGYVLITFQHWSLETTFWFAVVCLIVVFFVLHLLLNIISTLLNCSKFLHNWRQKRRLKKARRKTRQGLIEFSEGYWSEAKQHLEQAIPDAEHPLLNYLTAACASQKMGDYRLRDNFLREAQRSAPEATIAIELTQAQLQLANNQWEQALATLRHLQDLAPKHPYVLKLLMRLYKEVKDWHNLIELLPTLHKYAIIKPEAFKQLRKQAYYNNLNDMIKHQQSAEAIEGFVHQIPKTLLFDENIMSVFCQYLLSTNQNNRAETLLRQALRKQFSNDLFMLYIKIATSDAHIEFIETLQKKNPHSGIILYGLGVLTTQKHLWGKAKSYLAESLRLQPSPDAYFALAKLHEELDEHEAAYNAYREGLRFATENSLVPDNDFLQS